jgi:DNA-binding transcriptional LysR family regulator
LLGLANGAALPLAVECDDVGLLKQIALATDTVLASTHPAVQAEVAAGQFRQLEMQGLPRLHSAMGIVSLKGRSHSPMAQFAVDYLTDLVSQQAP